MIDRLLAKGLLERVEPDAAAKEAMADFDRRRRNRNRSEYELRFFDEAEVHADLAHARAIVEAVAASF